jgi:Beta-propeller repeat
VLYATYFGGNARDSARGVAVDSAGNAYVTGFTNSLDFPATAGAYRSPSPGQADAFAIKVNAAGSALVYSALIGGAGSDFATGIAVDPSGSAYIVGYTSSVAFPVTSAGFQKTFGGGLQDAFVAKLNSSGSGLIYCTYLGGAGDDIANGIAVNAAGQAYVVGYTDSGNFPTRSPIYANAGGQGDAFVAKLTPAGDSLVFSTYLGGSSVDIATAVALDSSGNVYVTGTTLSANFPVTVGAFQTLNQGSYDAFVSKLASQGTSILYSTYIGGEGSDQSSSIAVGADGTVYIGGFTYSSHFPLQIAVVSATHGGQEAFTAAVGLTGSSLVWSTYLGGAADDQATGIAVDPLGGVYVVGATLSRRFSNDIRCVPACLCWWGRVCGKGGESSASSSISSAFVGQRYNANLHLHGVLWRRIPQHCLCADHLWKWRCLVHFSV